MNEIEQILNNQNQNSPASITQAQDPRKKKQLVIGGIVIGTAIIIVGLVLWLKLRPTCDDGKKNGKEEGIDCGVAACGIACPIAQMKPASSRAMAVHTWTFNLPFPSSVQ